MNNGYFLGKDGKYYDSISAVNNADRVVENQQKQTEILEKQARDQNRQNIENQRLAMQMAEATRQQSEQIQKQNEIAMLQALQEQMKMEQGQQLEKERQEHELKLEQIRQEHEKEQRLLKILDEVSIPLELYNKFEEKLLSGGRLSKEEAERNAELMDSYMTLLENNEKELEEWQEVIKKNLEDNDEEVKYTEKYKKFEDWVNGKISITEFNDEDIKAIDEQEIKDTFDKMKKEVKNKQGLLKYIKIIYPIFGIVMIILFFNEIKYMWLLCLALFSVLLIPKGIYEKIGTGKIKVQINKTINEQMVNEIAKDNYEKKLKNIQGEMQEALKSLQERNKIFADKELEKLYEFRKNHYNMRIEKLFYDVGLVNKCKENNYKWQDINKDDIINEGTYEDYFHYFNDYNPIDEEKQEG